MSNKFKITVPVVVGVAASDPTDVENGLIYYSSSTNSLRIYENARWRTLEQATLAESNVIIGNSSGIGQAVDTSALGDILGATATGFTIKAGVVTDSYISGSAAIQLSKLAALTASRAIVSSAGGVLSAATTTATQIGYLSNLSSDVQTQLDAKLALAGGTMTGAINMGSNAITNLADPSNPQDAATKNYVDGKLQGLGNKFEVRASTTAALPTNTYFNGTSGVGATLTATANGALTSDGVTLVVGDRLLVKNEAASENNGIYDVTQVGSAGAPYILTRATDADSSTSTPAKVAPDLFVFVSEGTSNADTGWVLTTDAPITMGTTSLSFTQFAGAGSISAGTGLSKSGNTLNINIGNGLSTDGSNNLVVQAANSTVNVAAGGVKVATGGITDNEVSASAAIARSKIAAGTTGQVVINDPSTGALSSEANLAISRGGTSAGTQQAAIDALSGLTTQGDILHHDGTHASRLARGANGTVLMAGASDVSYVDPTLTLAKTDLSNLAAGGTAINKDLLPSTDNSLALGSSSKRWTKVNTLSVDSGASDLTQTANAGANAIVQVAASVKRGATSSNFVQESYNHSIALSASQTGVAIAVFTVAYGTNDALEITYKIKDNTTGAIRIGQFRAVTDGSVVSYSDTYTETADAGITLVAALNGANMEIRYTSNTTAKTMRADAKAFLV